MILCMIFLFKNVLFFLFIYLFVVAVFVVCFFFNCLDSLYSYILMICEKMDNRKSKSFLMFSIKKYLLLCIYCTALSWNYIYMFIYLLYVIYLHFVINVLMLNYSCRRVFKNHQGGKKTGPVCTDLRKSSGDKCTMTIEWLNGHMAF